MQFRYLTLAIAIDKKDANQQVTGFSLSILHFGNPITLNSSSWLRSSEFTLEMSIYLASGSRMTGATIFRFEVSLFYIKCRMESDIGDIMTLTLSVNSSNHAAFQYSQLSSFNQYSNVPILYHYVII